MPAEDNEEIGYLGEITDYTNPFTSILKMTMRPGEMYGDVVLSVQASAGHYCTPRVNLLPIEEYRSVEVGLRSNRNELVAPSALGIEGFDDFFEDGRSPVAPYMPQADVQRLREALIAKYGPSKE